MDVYVNTVDGGYFHLDAAQPHLPEQAGRNVLERIARVRDHEGHGFPSLPLLAGRRIVNLAFVTVVEEG